MGCTCVGEVCATNQLQKQGCNQASRPPVLAGPGEQLGCRMSTGEIEIELRGMQNAGCMQSGSVLVSSIAWVCFGAGRGHSSTCFLGWLKPFLPCPPMLGQHSVVLCKRVWLTAILSGKQVVVVQTPVLCAICSCQAHWCGWPVVEESDGSDGEQEPALLLTDVCILIVALWWQTCSCTAGEHGRGRSTRDPCWCLQSELVLCNHEIWFSFSRTQSVKSLGHWGKCQAVAPRPGWAGFCLSWIRGKCLSVEFHAKVSVEFSPQPVPSPFLHSDPGVYRTTLHLCPFSLPVFVEVAEAAQPLNGCN